MSTIIFRPISRSMILSVAFHALAFFILGIIATDQYYNDIQNLAPRGILLEMGAYNVKATNLQNTSSPKKLIAKKIVEIKSPYYHDQEKSHEKSEEASSGIGNSTAQFSGSGTVGDPNGMAASISEHYLYELKLLIEQNKLYPAQSRRLGQEGKVIVSFVIQKNGTITDIKITDPAKFPKLNEAALKLIENLKQFNPIPNELKRDLWAIVLPIEYKLD